MLKKKKTNKFSKLINILAITLITILSLLALSFIYKNNIIRNKSNLLLKKNNELLIERKDGKKPQKGLNFLSTVSHELRTL
jgi:hypothetical protein